MGAVTCRIVKHDGGWAYEVNGTYSEKFSTREAARKAARLAACEQVTPGETTSISCEDERGQADGRDGPKTTVEG